MWERFIVTTITYYYYCDIHFFILGATCLAEAQRAVAAFSCDWSYSCRCLLCQRLWRGKGKERGDGGPGEMEGGRERRGKEMEGGTEGEREREEGTGEREREGGRGKETEGGREGEKGGREKA